MRVVLNVESRRAEPDAAAILESQGIPADRALPERIAVLLDDALELFHGLADPRIVFAGLSKTHFEEIFRGEGRNHPDAVLTRIFPRAEALALYAATAGEPVCARIRELFAENDPALGCMLDSVASAAADKLSEVASRYYLQFLEGEDIEVLPYSPGYCGWHISGQRALFEYLGPAEIGIGLNSSFLMQPLKSVSGLLVAGPSEIHRFDGVFPYCAECRTLSCRGRTTAVTDI